MLTTSMHTNRDQKMELWRLYGGNLATPDYILHVIWRRALEKRFRELPPDRQKAVILSIGCDDTFSCPLVEAYGLVQVVGNWDAEEQAAMAPYGIGFEDYRTFLTWNDGASEAEIAQCQAWLRQQQGVRDGNHS